MANIQRKKIMILYASYGEGHYQVARALRDKFAEYGGYEVVMIDLFKKASPTIDAITKYLYIQSYRVLPALYGWLYYGTKHLRWHSFFAKWLQSYGIYTLKELLKEERPNLVIHTFPMSVMPEIRRRTGMYIPCVSVVTDFDLHRRWVHPGINRYYVATADLKSKFVKAGIPEDHICVSGIPIKPVFEKEQSVETILDKFRLEKMKHTVLIMAGAYGVMQGLAAVCERLSQMDGVQVIVVCGNKSVLKKEMQRKFGSRENVRIFGYVEQIHELMRIATCIVTKPGGITLSEAITMRLPIVLYRPVPGQEKDNARYLSKHGAASIAYDPEQLQSLIRQLLQDEDRLRQMQVAIDKLRSPHSSSVIVRDLINYMESQQRVSRQGMS